MTTQTKNGICKAKDGWQSCRYHGSGFSYYRTSNVTAPLQEKSRSRYLKILHATLLDPTPTNEARENYIEKAKEKAAIYQLVHDSTVDGGIELDKLYSDARKEGDADYADMVYVRKENAANFNSLLDAETTRIEGIRVEAEEAAIKQFGDLKSPEAKKVRDEIYKAKITDLYATNPRIRPVAIQNHGVNWDTRITNKALLECVSETLRRDK